mmetsp:Transcript_12899/g.23236  ORF Transcript_12899/g.23236 Transcript_12899/m.23236 type:complete len:85 (+) Transcript_12899:1997-2251(+)
MRDLNESVQNRREHSVNQRALILCLISRIIVQNVPRRKIQIQIRIQNRTESEQIHSDIDLNSERSDSVTWMDGSRERLVSPRLN